MKQQYELDEIPFYYTILSVPANPWGLPDKLKFLLEQDDNGFIRQLPSKGEQEYLDLVYQKGSQITGLMDDKGIGRLYTDDFLKYICEEEKNVYGKEILEIGCGTGYLLYRLQKLGARVLGVEPGEHGQEGRKKYGIPILKDFFNPDKIAKKYDIVIIYAVLEHMFDADKFLQEIISILNIKGKIILAVPDCEPYIQIGDVSMLIHEHWNYFTKRTLETLAINNGLRGHIINSEFAGTLYACWERKDEAIEEKDTFINYELSEYINKVNIQKEKMFNFINSHIINKFLGIYVPGRMINLLSLCYSKIPAQIRFFDDNTNLHNTYFPGIDIRIENFEDLTNNPVDTLLIASFTFGNKIKEKILANGLKCKIILLEELFM